MLPRLYAILDAEALERLGLELEDTALRLTEAGVRLLQYRDKRGDREVIWEAARRLADQLEGSGCLLILNDHADLVVSSGFGGVHVGQGDVDAFAARSLIGAGRVLGVSTHSEGQLRAAAESPADYVAIGPVFATGTKADAEPVVGVEGVRRARALTSKPLVAIGGITTLNVREVLDAGADSVAVIGALFDGRRDVRVAARELLKAASESI